MTGKNIINMTKHLNDLQKTLKEQITQVQKEIDTHIKTHSELKRKVDCITSINGVGILTAAVVISEMNDFQ